MKSTVKQVLLTIFSGLGVILGIVLLNGIVARKYGIDSLGEYLLLRRIISALIPLALFGIAIGIPRNMGIAKDDPVTQAQIVKGGIQLFAWFGVPVILVSGLFFILFPSLVGSTAHTESTVVPLVVLAGALALHQVAFAYFRGQSRLGWANLLQVLNVGLIPLTIALFSTSWTIGELVLWHGVLAGVIAISALLRPLFRGLTMKESISSMRQIRLKLLDYSLRRVGAVVGMVLLLTLGPILMANFATKEDLAYFSVGVQINRLFFSLFGPIGIVLLPKFAYEVSKGQIEGVNRGLSMIFQASTAIGLFAMVHLYYFAKPILENWLGESTADGVLIFRLFALSIPFYLWFENARNPIDAYSHKGYNSKNLLISLGVLLVTLLGLISLGKVRVSLAITWSYVVGYLVLGLLSFLTCRHLYRFKWSGIRTVIQILLVNGIILSIIGMAIRFFSFTPETIWHLAIIEIIAFTVYIFCIFLLKQNWLFYLMYHLGIGKPSFADK